MWILSNEYAIRVQAPESGDSPPANYGSGDDLGELDMEAIRDLLDNGPPADAVLGAEHQEPGTEANVEDALEPESAAGDGAVEEEIEGEVVPAEELAAEEQATEEPEPPAPEIDPFEAAVARITALGAGQPQAPAATPTPPAAPPAAPAQPTQPEHGAGAPQPAVKPVSVPKGWINAIQSEDPAEVQQGMDALATGVADYAVRQALEQVQAGIAAQLVPWVQQQVSQAVSLAEINTSFYGAYPQLNRPELRQIVASTMQKQAADSGAQAYTPELASATARALYTLLGVPMPENGAAPAGRPSKQRVVRAPGGSSPSPAKQGPALSPDQVMMLDLVQNSRGG